MENKQVDLPLGYFPHERIGWLIEHYNKLEVMRLEMWDLIQEVKMSLETIGESQNIRGVDSVASYDGNTLKIVVNDILPRSCLAEVKNSKSPLRYRWLKGIVNAVSDLRKSVVLPCFKRAHSIIVVCLPRKANWDVDNRVYKFVIDGLRYANVIKNDTADKLAFTVVGEVDKKKPRTEIIVREYCNKLINM